MYIWGLHLIDVLLLVVYMVAMLLIGKFLSKTVTGQTEFYLAGRKLGKLLQFFLNFGAATDATSATSLTSEVYRQGVGGAWLVLQYVFLTPFYWFSSVWLRRARVLTLGDLFEERLDSKACGMLYGFYALLFSVFIIGFSNLAAYKTVAVLFVKAPGEYSAKEQKMIADFHEYRQLEKTLATQQPGDAEKQRYRVLDDLSKKGLLHGYVSYIQSPLAFYVVYCSIVGLYMILGGFRAAVLTDAVQGVLIVVFSVILIPVGLKQVGGVEKLYEAIPDRCLQLFGSAATSDYTWYSVLAILSTTLVGSFAAAHMLTVAGSAKDEFSARLGAFTGSFGKRLLTLAWILCAFLAIAIFGRGLSDPDIAWGALSRELLGPGLLGCMLIGIIAANMSSIDATLITASALFVRNIYAPCMPDRSERHYVFVGRVTAVAVLALGTVIALIATGMIPLFKVLLSLPAVFGSAVFLMFFWRRLTRTAVVVEVSLLLIVTGVLPYLLPAAPGFRQIPSLLVETPGTAAVFFESVAHVDPYDPSSPREGIGRFHTEIYLSSLMGVPVETFSKAGLVTTRFVFSFLTPFVLLLLISRCTASTRQDVLDRFYVKMKTPVAATLEQDALDMQQSLADPARFDHQKLFPRSDWEFCRWTRADAWGFLVCWAGVGLIMLLLGAIV